MISCLCGCTLHLSFQNNMLLSCTLWLDIFLMFNAAKWVLSCGRYSLFCTNISYILIQGSNSLCRQTICSYWQCPLSFHSHQMKWCNVPHMYEIFMTRDIHHYTVKTIKEAAASCTLMLAMPMFYSDSKNGNVATSSWSTAIGTEYK